MLKLTDNALGMLNAQYRTILKNTLRQRCAAIILAACFFAPPGASASPADFRTQEYNNQWGLEMIHAAEAYDYTSPFTGRKVSGAGILVGVLDSGINAYHQEFINRNVLGVKKDYGIDIETGNPGHGTHVSGIIGAAKDNAGMHGVAYGNQLIVYSISNDDGAINWEKTRRGLDTLTDPAKCEGGRIPLIINNSWGVDDEVDVETIKARGEKDALYDVYEKEIGLIDKAIHENGQIVVFAASNTGLSSPDFFPGLPYLYPELDLTKGFLAVTAVGADGQKAWYSDSAGAAKYWTIAAPGGSGDYYDYSKDILSVAGLTNYDYVYMPGTSMGAPHVSGAAALVWEAFPHFNNAQVVQMLLLSADNSGNYFNKDIYGWGLLNVGNAVQGIIERDTLDFGEGAGVFTLVVPINRNDISVSVEKSKLILDGDYTFDGVYVHGDGILQVGNGGYGGLKGDVTNNGNLTFSLADYNYGGDISGTGSLTKAGTGTLTLSGTNGYKGMTTVQSGVLELGGNLTASSGLTLYENTTFKTGGHAHNLNGRKLTVWGKATYDGDLSASGAAMNFIAPGAVTALTVSGKAEIEGGTVNLNLPNDHGLTTSNEISLIKADGVLTSDATLCDGSRVLRSGALLEYDLSLKTTANELLAAVGQGRASEDSKTLSEGRLAGLAILREGQDLITDQGINNALSMAGKEDGAAVFAATGYSKGRYNTGSYIDNHGWSMVAGLAKENKRPDGRLTWGGFFEGGRGSYSSFNAFASGDTHGGGKTDYAGIGAFIRHDGAGNENGYHYNEGSARMGRAKNDFAAILNGMDAGYTARSLYFGAHYGYGYIKKLAKGAAIDLYGKLLYTRQNGDSVTTASGDDVSFDAVDSLRLRIGTEYKRPVNTMTSVSYGLAYEYELAGEQKATTYGYAIDAPGLRGGSVLASIGLNYKERPDSNFSLGLNITGYAGKREGVSFNAQMQWTF